MRYKYLLRGSLRKSFDAVNGLRPGMFPPDKRFDTFSSSEGCPESLNAFRFFSKLHCRYLQGKHDLL